MSADKIAIKVLNPLESADAEMLTSVKLRIFLREFIVF